MKARSLIPLIIGLGVGFFAIKMGIDVVRKAKAGHGDVVEVVVTATPVGVATRITEAMLASKSVPQELMPGDAFTDQQVIVGRVTAMSVSAGVPITPAMLAPPGSQPGLRAKIPEGYRAVSISVNEESAVAGFVMPGSRVDVYASGGNGSARLILSDVEVGAVGQSLSEVGKDGRTVRITKSVTLFLKPEEIKTLHASAGGRKSKALRLALRGNSKKKQGDSFWSHVMANALQKSLQRPVVEEQSNIVAVASRRHIVDVVRGTDVERLVFVEAGVAGEYRPMDEPANEINGRTGFGKSVVPPDMEMLE